MTNAVMERSSLDALTPEGRVAAGDASPSWMFEGGRRLGANRGAGNPVYQERLVEVFNLYQRVLSGDRYAAHQFTEAMSTSDFSSLFGDILDRQILAKYVSAPVQWTAVARRGRVRDFRTVKRFTLDGGEATLSPVQQLTEYPAASLTDGGYSYSVAKYGRRIPLSWETLINDDLDAFGDIPNRLGNAGRRTEEKFVTSLYAGTTGPNGTFFSTAHKNIINPTVLTNVSVTNPPLTVTNLMYAFQALAQQVDADGAPIYVEAATLVVPPALEVAAMNIINATEIVTAAGSGGAASDAGRPDTLRTANWIARKISVVVNPWLPIISTTNGNTSWYLFADPNVGRPAMELGFLIGHEVPELFQKSPNAMRVGGGMINPEEGDFETDSVEWKLRHVLGGVLEDYKSGIGSNGSGS